MLKKAYICIKRDIFRSIKLLGDWESLRPHGLYGPWNSPSKNTGVGSRSLLQGLFPTEGSNPGLQHCRQILNQLSHQGSPRILEWGAYPFSRGSAWLRNRTRVYCIAGRFFTSWATREAQLQKQTQNNPQTWKCHVTEFKAQKWNIILVRTLPLTCR